MPWQRKTEAPEALGTVATEPVEMEPEQFDRSDIDTLLMLEAQVEARKVKAQSVLDRRAAEQAELARIEAVEMAELEAAAAELYEVQAQLQAAQERAEQERKIKVVQEFEASGIMRTLAEKAVKAYWFVESKPDVIEQARAAITQMFEGVDAPPREAWTTSGNGDSYLCEVPLLDGKVLCAVDIRAGLEAPGIILYGLSERVPGVRIENAATLGRLCVEYPEIAALFGLTDAEALEPPVIDDAAFLAQFGLSAL